MVDQFVAEKCLYAASTDNLVLDNRSDPHAIQMVQILGTGAENRCKTPGVARRGCSRLELIDA